MPIYEYFCEDCGKEFEEFIFSDRDEVRCPQCDGERARKMISRCRTRMGGDISPAGPSGDMGGSGGCSSCGGGSCGTCA